MKTVAKKSPRRTPKSKPAESPIPFRLVDAGGDIPIAKAAPVAVTPPAPAPELERTLEGFNKIVRATIAANKPGHDFYDRLPVANLPASPPRPFPSHALGTRPKTPRDRSSSTCRLGARAEVCPRGATSRENRPGRPRLHDREVPLARRRARFPGK